MSYILYVHLYLFVKKIGGESNDSFFIEGPSNTGSNPEEENFAEDGGFGHPHSYQGHFGGPRGPPMGPRGPMGMRPMRPFGGPMGPRPYGMRGPPHGPYGGLRGGPHPPRGPPPQRFQGPPPRGMGQMGGPRGPPPNMQCGYDYSTRPMRPQHYSSEQMGGNMEKNDGQNLWDVVT